MQNSNSKIIKKVLLSVLLLYSCINASAQEATAIYDTLPEYGINLIKSWHYSPNDNTDFAKPGFDDNKWYDINPAENLNRLPQLKTVKTGWLRLRF